MNDVSPPSVALLNRVVSSGRPTIVARIRDAKAGVDPFSLRLLLGSGSSAFEVGATRFDRETGIAAFPVPREANPLRPGSEFMRIVASDFQEAKNIGDTGSTNPMPNTRIHGIRLDVRSRPAVTWILPNEGQCLAARQRLFVVANDNLPISSIGFFDGKRQIGRIRRQLPGLFEMTWRTTGKRRGVHVLTAVASDTGGREAEASAHRSDLPLIAATRFGKLLPEGGTFAGLSHGPCWIRTSDLGIKSPYRTYEDVSEKLKAPAKRSIPT